MLPGDEPLKLHIKTHPLAQSFQGDPPGPHRPAETRCSRRHVNPGADRRVLKVGRAIPHQDAGIRVGILIIPSYGTLRLT